MPDQFGWHQQRWGASVQGPAERFVSDATALLLEQRGELRAWRRSYAEVALGSRGSLRFWGFMTTKRAIPVVVRITASDKEDGRVSAHLWILSNPGWYMADILLGVSSWIYRRAFAYYAGLLKPLGDFEVVPLPDIAADPFNLPPEPAEDIVGGFLMSVAVEPRLDSAIADRAKSALSSLEQGNVGVAALQARQVVADIRGLPREDGARRLAQRPLDDAIQDLEG